MGVMHGVFPDGRIVRKVEAFRQAYRAVGLGWLLAPTGWPLLRQVFDGLTSCSPVIASRLGGSLAAPVPQAPATWRHVREGRSKEDQLSWNLKSRDQDRSSILLSRG
jgi:hypothetical protein